MVLGGIPHERLSAADYSRTVASYEALLRDVRAELSLKIENLGVLQQELEDLRKASTAKDEYLSVLHTAIFALGDKMVNLTDIWDNFQREKDASQGVISQMTGSRKKRVTTREMFGNTIGDAATAYSELRTPVERSEIYRKAQAAVERPEAASKETEEAEERAILAADRLEAAEKKVKTKKNAAKDIADFVHINACAFARLGSEAGGSGILHTQAAASQALADAEVVVDSAVIEATSAHSETKAAADKAEVAQQDAKNEFERPNVLEILLSSSPKLSGQDKEQVDEALLIKAEEGDLDFVQNLIARGANVDVQDNQLWTPMMLASFRGHSDIVEVLLTHGANIEAREDKGFTSLIIASQNGHLGVVEVLLTHRANIEAKQYEEFTSLMIASQHDHLDVVEVLLTHEAKIEAKADKGFTSLLIASQNGHLDVVEVLLIHEANIEAKQYEGFTSLMIASQNDHLGVVEALLTHEANIEAQGEDQWTSLMIASKIGHLDVVEALIARGAQIDARNNYKSTPLIWASRKKHLEVVTALISAGASVNLRANDGKTALSWANDSGHSDIAQVLQDAGAQL